MAGAALILGALVLGLVGARVAETEALRAWERTHFPSARLWRRSLTSMGYVAIEDPDRLHRVLRSLPGMLDGKGAIWASDDRRWIAIYAGQDSADPPLAFIRDGDRQAKPPPGWSPLGRGWTALDRLLAEVEKLPATPPSSRPRSANAGDPRALRY